MKKLLSSMLLLAGCNMITVAQNNNGNSYSLTPVPFNKVLLQDQFWLPRLNIEQKTLLPFAFEKTQPAVDNLRKTANFLKGVKDELPFPHRFVASDLYKVMEGASYLLLLKRDTMIERKMDDIIAIIEGAQKPDGYLYEAHITGVAAQHDAWGGGGMGDKPYSWEVHSHELYNMGHMYEGAVAYYMATGKDRWLKVAEKSATHINKVFFDGDPNYNNGKPVMQAPGHQELELALVKMYRVTGKDLYLQMAKKFLDIRGVTYKPGGTGVMADEYAQQHLPVKDQRKAVGHAVRAAYLYSGMADVSALTNDTSYFPALTGIWHDIVDTKMHITGGLGAVHGIEGFGPAYELPNKDAYDETCAAVGNVLFNHRMFLMSQDAKYMDVAEVALFNNVLAGVNLEGNKFFYVNPLETNGETPFNAGLTGRSAWFGTACCPTNISRLLPQVSGMMYAYSGNTIFCTLYGSNTTTLPLEGGTVTIKQTSNYPFDEQIAFSVTPGKENQAFDIKFRIPTWSGDQFVPGELYKYVDRSLSDWSVEVNGQKVTAKLVKGFATISGKWNTGDKIVLNLPMPVHFSKAIDAVTADRNRIAVTRGPLVYCGEDTDNKGDVLNYFIPEIPAKTTIKIHSADTGLLQGIYNITLPSSVKESDKVSPKTLKLVPYYSWNNRGDGGMEVWFPTRQSLVKSAAAQKSGADIIDRIAVSTNPTAVDPAVLRDGIVPVASNSTGVKQWVSTEKQDEPQWIECSLKKPVDIQSIAVYWADDNQRVKMPAKWKIAYQEQGEWVDLPLYVTDSYAVLKNQFNLVHPGKQIVTDKLRIIAEPQPNAAVGVFEVKVAVVEGL